MTDSNFAKLTQTLFNQQSNARRVDSWIYSEALGFEIPHKAKAEHRALAELSRTPWLGLVVTTAAQALRVGDITSNGERVEDLYRLWVDNGLKAQQMAFYRAVLAYGNAFTVTTLGVDGRAKIRFVSPTRCAVIYNDPADIYPVQAIEVAPRKGDRARYWLYSPGVTQLVEEDNSDPDGKGYVVLEEFETGLDVCPVVEACNQRTLDGKVIGEVTPLIPTAQRINKSAYDRLLMQHFNSWKVRYATGIDLPREEVNTPEIKPYVPGEGIRGPVGQPPINAPAPIDEAEAEKVKLRLAQDDFLVSSYADAKFGTLEASSMDDIIAAFKADVESLAAVSQTPAHALVGSMINVSGDALAEARAPLTQKISERQEMIGDAFVRTLKIAAGLMGDYDTVEDPYLTISWRDMEIRSLSQAADALGKASQMLEIPARGLWDRIPGTDAAELQKWEKLHEEDAKNDPLTAIARRQTTPISEPQFKAVS